MSLQNIIETAFENRAEINPNTVTPEVREAVLETIRQLDSGKLRVAERLGVGEWKVNEWAKKAVLLSFRIQDNEVLNDGVNKYFDKVPTKFADWSEDEFRSAGFRAVPGAVARRGSFVAKNVVLMPSYVNIGAYVDEGAMVDTWATVGSCAQIGKNVHLSGGVGIGDDLLGATNGARDRVTSPVNEVQGVLPVDDRRGAHRHGSGVADELVELIEDAQQVFSGIAAGRHGRSSRVWSAPTKRLGGVPGGTSPESWAAAPEG